MIRLPGKPWGEGQQFGKSGFTLMEMIITLAIFVLLAAAVFGIITSILQSASTLQDNQQHRDQIVALNDFLKKKLGTLSAKSGLTTYRRGDGEGLIQNGIIFGEGTQATAIDAKIQANGFYTLRIATFVANSGTGASTETTTSAGTVVDPGGQQLAQFFQDAINTNDASINWIPLIKDVKTLAWKFQDFNATDWADLWNNPNAKPNLIELSLQLAGDVKPATMDYWIPKLEAITVAQPANAAATTTTTP